MGDKTRPPITRIGHTQSTGAPGSPASSSHTTGMETQQLLAHRTHSTHRGCWDQYTSQEGTENIRRILDPAPGRLSIARATW